MIRTGVIYSRLDFDEDYYFDFEVFSYDDSLRVLEGECALEDLVPAALYEWDTERMTEGLSGSGDHLTIVVDGTSSKAEDVLWGRTNNVNVVARHPDYEI